MPTTFGRIVQLGGAPISIRRLADAVALEYVEGQNLPDMIRKTWLPMRVPSIPIPR